MIIMPLTCYVGGQIDSVTESSTVLQDTNLQFTENDKLSVTGAVKKQHAQQILMEDFLLLFSSVFFFSEHRNNHVFLFFQKLSV